MIPVTPAQAAEAVAAERFPNEAIEAFNTLIRQNLRGGVSAFRLDDVVAEMVRLGLNESDIFEKHWLDVEPYYREYGWVVEYDQPGFNEEYPATFTFTDPSR